MDKDEGMVSWQLLKATTKTCRHYFYLIGGCYV